MVCALSFIDKVFRRFTLDAPSHLLNERFTAHDEGRAKEEKGQEQSDFCSHSEGGSSPALRRAVEIGRECMRQALAGTGILG